jgi:hypothetical protein
LSIIPKLQLRQIIRYCQQRVPEVRGRRPIHPEHARSSGRAPAGHGSAGVGGHEAVQAFQADADQRNWTVGTVGSERFSSLAHDMRGEERDADHHDRCSRVPSGQARRGTGPAVAWTPWIVPIGRGP